MISLEKLKILTPLQKLPKNVGDLSKLIIAKGFKKLPKLLLPTYPHIPNYQPYVFPYSNWHLPIYPHAESKFTLITDFPRV